MLKPKPLYLDDLRTPSTDRGWVVCRSVQEAKDYVCQKGCPNLISFDHDLGDEVPTGYDFAKWLVEADMDSHGDGSFIPNDFTYNVHSANGPGAANIRGLLDNYLEVRSRLNS